MILTKEWYNQLLDCIKIFSDEEYQRQVWLNGEGKESSSFIEASCQLFDDTALSYYLDETEEVIATKECNVFLSELSSMIDSVDENLEPRKIINTPQMIKIRKKANEIILILEKYIENMD